MKARIRNGEFSERALAGLFGVSQPQLHNVLKGQRKLQTSLADVMLSRFQISVIDLLSTSEKAYIVKSLSPDSRDTPQLSFHPQDIIKT